MLAHASRCLLMHKDIGVLLGHRRIMLAAIGDLAGARPAVPKPVAAAGFANWVQAYEVVRLDRRPCALGTRRGRPPRPSRRAHHQLAHMRAACSAVAVAVERAYLSWDAIAASGVETWLLGPRRWRANPLRLGFRGRRFYWFALPAEAAVQRQALARSRSVPRQRSKTAKAEKQR